MTERCVSEALGESGVAAVVMDERIWWQHLEHHLSYTQYSQHILIGHHAWISSVMKKPVLEASVATVTVRVGGPRQLALKSPEVEPRIEEVVEGVQDWPLKVPRIERNFEVGELSVSQQTQGQG
ncbi:hypothetical protein Pmani_006319 [Petrolisthes manimaculis]|uniref:Uncharacterized protein n=1 Tax=Petrolisthes manimaculis TaxID=1843537 RepID=A0AAE1UFU3_9EUCA|nr:hypothetical protein Pmani_006319 [Petrolisthes manimaculis]